MKLFNVIHNKPINKDIELPALSDHNYYQLDNGIETYEYNFPNSAEVIKLELVFKAGRLYEKHKLAAKICSAIIKEGTKNYNSKEIANILDFHGAYIDTQSSMDYSKINILCLNKHFLKISKLIQEVVFYPSFDMVEFNKHKQRAIENLKMQLSKNDILGYRELTEQIFGPTHPYGYNSIQEDYKNLKIDVIKQHYNDLYTTTNCKLFVSGNINDELRTQIKKCLGSVERYGKEMVSEDFIANQNHFEGNKLVSLKGKQSIQKAIYIGGKLFARNHEDYFGVVVLNTLLGGYFSSRLNRRIREKEALTYGIDAQLDMMTEDGFFYITTEVENKNEKATLKAIYEELEILQKELVSEEELKNVKRYIKGQILSSLDGPFKQIKMLQSLVMMGSDPKDYEIRVQKIENVTKEELLFLANKYFKKENLYEVVVAGE